MKVKNFLMGHTVFSVALLIILVGLNVIMSTIVQNYNSNPFSPLLYVSYSIPNLILFSIFLFIMIKCKYIQKKSIRKCLVSFLLGFPFITYVFILAMNLFFISPDLFDVNYSLLLSLILYNLSIGLLEETGARGVLMPLLYQKWSTKKWAKLKAAIVSSLIFGSLHSFRLIIIIVTTHELSNDDIISILIRVLYTTFAGMLFAAITMYCNSIIPAIIWHAIIDFSGLLIFAIIPQFTYSILNNNGELNSDSIMHKLGFPPFISENISLVLLFITTIYLIFSLIYIKKFSSRWMAD